MGPDWRIPHEDAAHELEDEWLHREHYGHCLDLCDHETCHYDNDPANEED